MVAAPPVSTSLNEHPDLGAAGALDAEGAGAGGGASADAEGVGGGGAGGGASADAVAVDVGNTGVGTLVGWVGASGFLSLGTKRTPPAGSRSTWEPSGTHLWPMRYS